MQEAILKLSKISKSFPGVKALEDVDFNIYSGKVMALVGENGAGKSTLMKVLSGVYSEYEGDIILNGNKVKFENPKEANDKAIAIIHQELNMIPYMTVYENIFLGRELKNKYGFLNRKEMIAKSQKLMDDLNIKLSPLEYVSELSVAQAQMVEIIKAISLEAKVIIMDEPTDALPENDVENLFKIINDLRDSGVGIVYISHKLKEIFTICDYITVLRDGKFISEVVTSDTNEPELIKMMVGRSLDEQFPHVDYDSKNVLFETKNLNNHHVKNISFDVKEGEIVGIYGLVGAGRTELAKTIYGVFKYSEGEIFLEGKKIKSNSPKQAIQNGIYYISEDRKKDGLILELNIKENTTISILKDFVKFNLIQTKKENKVCRTYKDKLRIKTPNILQQVKNLSGGNQQKVAISKGLITNPHLLIVDEPTRGVDVGAKKEIYDLINDFKMSGKSVILISSEMPEVLGMSDRIIIMNEGTIKGILPREEANSESIMKHILS